MRHILHKMIIRSFYTNFYTCTYKGLCKMIFSRSGLSDNRFDMKIFWSETFQTVITRQLWYHECWKIKHVLPTSKKLQVYRKALVDAVFKCRAALTWLAMSLFCTNSSVVYSLHFACFSSLCPRLHLCRVSFSVWLDTMIAL